MESSAESGNKRYRYRLVPPKSLGVPILLCVVYMGICRYQAVPVPVDK